MKGGRLNRSGNCAALWVTPQNKTLFFQLQICGKNLLAVCKLGLNVSNYDKNGKLFQEDKILGLYQKQLQLDSLN